INYTGSDIMVYNNNDDNKFELDFNPVKLARRTLEEYFKKDRVELSYPKGERIKAGAFVSLKSKQDSSLRGCIGTINPVQENVYQEIIKNTLSAAFRDPRFPALKEEELSQIKISVDILLEPEQIEEIDKLDPHKYGVIVEQGQKRAVLLPDLEGVNTVEKQLEIVAAKGSINLGDIYEGKADIYRFKVIRYKE
ncbi:MAG: AmmeMemoRadiSam system protein A, partial [Bacillota bacterium]